MRLNKKTAGLTVAVLVFAAATVFLKSESGRPPAGNLEQKANGKSASQQSKTTLELSPNQLSAIKIEPVGTRPFPIEKEGTATLHN